MWKELGVLVDVLLYSSSAVLPIPRRSATKGAIKGSFGIRCVRPRGLGSAEGAVLTVGSSSRVGVGSPGLTMGSSGDPCPQS